MLSDLSALLKDMASDKSLGLDGVMTELYKCLWLSFREEYLQMLNESIFHGSLPPGVSEDIIMRLHKGGGTTLSTIENIWHIENTLRNRRNSHCS
jgi:hypothetical protein